ncbi:hypothetical protein [Streptomyces sp. KN37]|uniref:hypothetical protein n=1 Tax=Streptomyces sp. KN37 TaxID=3090667 RepID=UPI002A75A8F2|nr:hypothetical protein [Streptomyces sp. KN37]WPO70264.1 hypothetical protein R9806_06275 [Streptomyces sp. KN37]
MYRAADDLADGKLSDWREDRGLVEISVARRAKPRDFIPSLNRTLADFLSQAEWYQVWDGEVVSANSPDSPLRCTFELAHFQPAPLLHIREHKGLVELHISPHATVERFVQALNKSNEEFLAGGRWFQAWKGEIVTMDSPETFGA